MVLEKTLESPLDSKIKSVHPKGNEPEYSLEGLMMRLKLQYFGHLMWRADSLEKTVMLGKIKAGEGDDRGWDGWIASPTQWTWVWASSRRWWRTEKPGGLQSMGKQRVRHDWATEQQQDPGDDLAGSNHTRRPWISSLLDPALSSLRLKTLMQRPSWECTLVIHHSSPPTSHPWPLHDYSEDYKLSNYGCPLYWTVFEWY